MQHQLQSVVTAQSCLFLSLSPFTTLSFYLFDFVLGLSEPVSIASLFGCSSGCSPDSAPSSGAMHVGSILNSDPPCSRPPRHVPVRHIIAFTHSSCDCLFPASLFLPTFSLFALSLRPVFLSTFVLVFSRQAPSRCSSGSFSSCSQLLISAICPLHDALLFLWFFFRGTVAWGMSHQLPC